MLTIQHLTNEQRVSAQETRD